MNKNLKIGICWAGRPRHIHDPYRNRCCPVNLLEKLAELPNVIFYNLQYNQGGKKDLSVEDRCRAKVANGEQCSRKHKEDELF